MRLGVIRGYTRGATDEEVQLRTEAAGPAYRRAVSRWIELLGRECRRHLRSQYFSERVCKASGEPPGMRLVYRL